jgi:ubiquinone/menaquinone biosynthesis C-methylase UbiE
MSEKTSWRILGLLAAAVLTVSPAARWGQAQTPTEPARTHSKADSKKVDPAINAQFQKADVKDFIRRFESNDREVFVRRGEIIKTLKLKPGMAVADIGAGTGLFTRLIANEVGPGGKVYAVDVSRDFLDHIASQARLAGQTQVATIRGTQDSTNLHPGSVDLVFLCDVYHHLENHEKILLSIHRALRLGGVLVMVEFNRVEGKSTQFVLKHVRAGQGEFVREIEAAGFELVSNFKGPRLKENFVVKFRKIDRTPQQSLTPSRGEAGQGSPGE